MHLKQSPSYIFLNLGSLNYCDIFKTQSFCTNIHSLAPICLLTCCRFCPRKCKKCSCSTYRIRNIKWLQNRKIPFFISLLEVVLDTVYIVLCVLLAKTVTYVCPSIVSIFHPRKLEFFSAWPIWHISAIPTLSAWVSEWNAIQHCTRCWHATRQADLWL